MKTFNIKSGKKARIVKMMNDRFSKTISFQAEPESGSGDISGTVIVAGSNWLFPKPEEKFPLEADNEVRKSSWDTFFSIYVQANEDCRIAVEPYTHSARYVLYILLAVLAIGVITPLIFALIFS